MGKSSIIKIVVGALAALLLLYFYMNRDDTPVYNWTTHYKTDSKDPYGCYLFHELLKESVGDDRYRKLEGPLSKTLQSNDSSNATYVFISDSYYYTEEDLYYLIEFVRNGNNAYLLFEDIPYDILDVAEVYSTIYFGSFEDETVSMKTYNMDVPIEISYFKDWKKTSSYWYYADSISEEQIEVLGDYSEEKFNYFKVKVGDGSLYIHLAPLVFTNFHLKEEKNMDYATSVLSDFNEGPVYWDDFSHIPTEETGMSESPLSFILSQESLRWAWYLLLGLGMIYLIFYTKRRQRVIPVTNKVRNSSIDFVQTIGSMYYQQEAHLRIISQQRQLFLTYIRTKYGIFSQVDDESFLKKVSLKSGIKSSEIDMIFKEAKRLELLGSITTKDLIGFNDLTENFYRNCK